MNNVIQHYFEPLKNEPCWGVQRGYGDVLKLEFGRPHLEIREPRESRRKMSARLQALNARRHVWVKGRWSLWTWHCDWVVRKNGRILGRSGVKDTAERTTMFLDGQKLISVSLQDKGARTTFRFDLGGELETTPCDNESEQWHLRSRRNYFLTIFADRTYTYGHGSRMEPRRRPIE